MKLNEKILRLRKEKGMSQEEIAHKLNVSRQSISKWETGESNPDIDNIVNLADLFNVSVDYLVKDDSVEKKDSQNEAILSNQESNNKREYMQERDYDTSMTLGKLVVCIPFFLWITVIIGFIGLSKAKSSNNQKAAKLNRIGIINAAAVMAIAVIVIIVVNSI